MNILDYDGVSIAIETLEVETEEYGDTLYTIKEGDILGFDFLRKSAIDESLSDEEINRNTFILFINGSNETLRLNALDFIKCFDILALSIELEEYEMYVLSKLSHIFETREGIIFEDYYESDIEENSWTEADKYGDYEDYEHCESCEDTDLDSEFSKRNIQSAIDKALDNGDKELFHMLTSKLKKLK